MRNDKNEINNTKKIINSTIKESLLIIQATPSNFSFKGEGTRAQKKVDGGEIHRLTLKE